MAKEIKLTMFEQAKKDLYEGKIKAPSVSAGGHDVSRSSGRRAPSGRALDWPCTP